MKRTRLLVASVVLLSAGRFLGAPPPEDKGSEDKGTKTTSKPRGDSISKGTLAGRVVGVIGTAKSGGSSSAGAKAGSAGKSAKSTAKETSKSAGTSASPKEKKTDSSKKQ